MINKYLHDPIHIVVKNPANDTVKHTYILLGNVPNNIKKIIESGKTGENKNTLKDFYGNRWREKLGLPAISGGDDEDIADISEYDLDFASVSAAKTEEESPDDLIDVTESDLMMGEDKTSEISGEIVKKILTIGNNVDLDSNIPEDSGVTFITDIFIYPEDKINEIKEKIYLITGIPYYRNHLYWKEYDKVTVPYNVYISGLYGINIETLYENAENNKMFEIPVDKFLYTSRSDMKIESLESFIISGNIKEFNNTYYVVDLDQFIRPIRTQLGIFITDTYQFEVFYFGFVAKYWPQMTNEVFRDYIVSELELYQKYPDLSKNRRYISEIYANEAKIINSKYNSAGLGKKLKEKHQIAFAITNIVVSSGGTKTLTINIRNLFDKFRISVKYPQVHAYLQHEDKKYLLKKAHIRNQSDILFPAMFKQDFVVAISLYKKDQDNFHKRSSVTTIENEQSKYVYLNVLSNGKYLVKALWNDEDGSGFDETIGIIKNFVDPVIKQINSYGYYVFPQGGSLPPVSRANIQFQTLNMSIFWKKLLSESIFRVLKTMWEPFANAGIISLRNIQQPNIYEFVFRKGIYDFDPSQIDRVMSAIDNRVISNQYSHLSNNTAKQKWDQLYSGRIVRMIHRTTDIKFEVVNIHEVEFTIFIDYLIYFINRSMNDPKLLSAISRKMVYGTVKKLKKLKETDPELYNLKKYGSKRVYSILCQNPRQPVIYTEDELSQMSDASKKRLIKYWNFTLNRDAYYGCPSKKYPHLMFIVGVHPKDYCLPCCGKEPSSEESKKLFINQICMNKHTFTQDDYRKREKIQDISGGPSRHIMNYGKTIDPGRLSRLPTSGIRKFFYASLEDKSYEFFIFGVPQNLPSAESIGILFSIAEATGETTDKIIDIFITAISKKPKIYEILSNGILTETFKSAEELIATMRSIFIGKKMLEVYMRTPFKRWSDVFVELSMYFLNLYIFVFIDDDGSGQTVDLYVNDLIKYEIISEKSDENFAKSDKKIMLCMKKFDSYFPIFVVNPEDYFKTLEVNKKLFKYSDKIVTNIIGMIKSNIISRRDTNKMCDLSAIKAFCSQNNQYKIKYKYINSRNFVYSVLLEGPSGPIYFPVEYSSNISDSIPVKFELFRRNDFEIKMSAVSRFISELNRFIRVNYVISESENIYEYSPVIPDSYAKIPDVGVIGIFFGPNLIYVSDFDTGIPDKAKYRILLYDPEIVNGSILEKRKPVPDNRTEKIGISLYENYLYQLFLYEFINYIESEKNTKIREKLINLINQTNFRKELSQFQSELKNILRGTSSDEKSDNKLLQNQLYSFYYEHFDKKLLIEAINGTKYNFDRKTLNKLKRMKKTELIAELKKIAGEFSVSTDLPGESIKFPNIYISCKSAEDIDYCYRGKLIVNKNIDILIDILAADILNPLKEKYIFSSLLTENIVNYFNFDTNPEDIITIVRL